MALKALFSRSVAGSSKPASGFEFGWTLFGDIEGSALLLPEANG